jgi:hypothetical protein
MNYNLIIQPEAEYDIQNAFEWYESQNPGLVRNLFVLLMLVCLELEDNPLLTKLPTNR